jgi:hypothetical protein
MIKDYVGDMLFNFALLLQTFDLFEDLIVICSAYPA